MLSSEKTSSRPFGMRFSLPTASDSVALVAAGAGMGDVAASIVIAGSADVEDGMEQAAARPSSYTHQLPTA